MAIRNELIDELLKDYKKPEDIIGETGILKQLTRAIIERALGAELTAHLGYEPHSIEGKNRGNSRNGTSRKTLKSDREEFAWSRYGLGNICNFYHTKISYMISQVLFNNYREFVMVRVLKFSMLFGLKSVGMVCFFSLLFGLSCDDTNPASNNPEVSVTGILLKSSTYISIGETEQLTPTITPNNATNKEVTWLCDKKSIATVSATGLVTGVSVGSAIITVTTNEGNFKASCAITVKEKIALKDITYDSMVDIEGNVYRTVKIGTQEWTVDNLRSTKYNDGTAITHGISKKTWDSCGEAKQGVYCFLQNTTNPDSIKIFGAYYNWYTVDSKKLAPPGWHVPTDADMEKLKFYLIENGYNWDGTKQNNKVAKSMAAKTYWRQWTVEGAVGNDLSKNNSSGFSAVPCGYRDYKGTVTFYAATEYSFWWTSTQVDTPCAFYRFIDHMSEGFYRYSEYNSFYSKGFGLSVRLVRD